MCQKPLRFNFNTQVYTANQQISLDPLCNSVSVKNQGTSTVEFQGDELQAGESKTIGGNFAEVLDGRVDITFTGAGTNKMAVTQKFYLPQQWISKELGI